MILVERLVLLLPLSLLPVDPSVCNLSVPSVCSVTYLLSMPCLLCLCLCQYLRLHLCLLYLGHPVRLQLPSLAPFTSAIYALSIPSLSMSAFVSMSALPGLSAPSAIYTSSASFLACLLSVSRPVYLRLLCLC